jgi:hypothetical protein
LLFGDRLFDVVAFAAEPIEEFDGDQCRRGRRAGVARTLNGAYVTGNIWRAR